MLEFLYLDFYCAGSKVKQMNQTQLMLHA